MAELIIWPQHYIVKSDKPEYFGHLINTDISLINSRDQKAMPHAYAGDSITFRQILIHTSGIPHIDKHLWVNNKLNLLFKPGVRFEYSTPRDFVKFAEGIIDNTYMSENDFDSLIISFCNRYVKNWL